MSKIAKFENDMSLIRPKGRRCVGWEENENEVLRPKNEDPPQITYKYLEMGISTLDV